MHTHNRSKIRSCHLQPLSASISSIHPRRPRITTISLPKKNKVYQSLKPSYTSSHLSAGTKRGERETAAFHIYRGIQRAHSQQSLAGRGIVRIQTHKHTRTCANAIRYVRPTLRARAYHLVLVGFAACRVCMGTARAAFFLPSP